VARNLHAKFGADRTVSEFFTIFFKQNPHPIRLRDVIDDVIEQSLLSD
jgi:hypothetical protein